MPRIAHLVVPGYRVIPKEEDSLAAVFRIAHTRYSQYFNKKLHASGHLWQGRFYSCVLDNRHLIATARYVERNPVRIKIAKIPTDYSWSSARNHTGVSHNDIIDTSALFKYVDVEQHGWEEFICESDEPDEVAAIRKNTMIGRPLGEGSFIQKLEKVFDRKLHALQVGRPKRIINKK